MKVAIIGGGAAGFFLALCLKEMDKSVQVSVFEKSDKVLTKHKMSGGGRCNCTNTFEYVKDLSQVYPRGHRTVKKLFNVFSPKDVYNWFERHGVKLKTEDGGRVFPVTDDSHTIINMFLHYAVKYGIDIRLNSRIDAFAQLDGYDFIAVTTGGMNSSGSFLNNRQDELSDSEPLPIIKPVPSLFAFRIDDNRLKSLAGLTIENVILTVPKTKYKTCGPVLITHNGISGPAVLKLSSYAAVLLNESGYKSKLHVNWVSGKDNEVVAELRDMVVTNSGKEIKNRNPFNLPQRFWEYMLLKIMPNRTDIRYKDVTDKEINRLVNILCNDELMICGRDTNKDEFVTCGGVALDAVDVNTMQLKADRRLCFAGEVLDIDGITGGYNFQAAWTTAFTAAKGILAIKS